MKGRQEFVQDWARMSGTAILPDDQLAVTGKSVQRQDEGTEGTQLTPGDFP